MEHWIIFDNHDYYNLDKLLTDYDFID